MASLRLPIPAHAAGLGSFCWHAALGCVQGGLAALIELGSQPALIELGGQRSTLRTKLPGLRDQRIAVRDQSLAYWTELAVVADHEHITRIAVTVLLHTLSPWKGSCNTVRRVQGDCPIRPIPGTHRVGTGLFLSEL
jgi:hypothetical protein